MNLVLIVRHHETQNKNGGVALEFFWQIQKLEHTLKNHCDNWSEGTWSHSPPPEQTITI